MFSVKRFKKGSINFVSLQYKNKSLCNFLTQNNLSLWDTLDDFKLIIHYSNKKLIEDILEIEYQVDNKIILKSVGNFMLKIKNQELEKNISILEDIEYFLKTNSLKSLIS